MLAILALALCSLPSAASAQDADPAGPETRSITYEEAVPMALERNTTVKRAQSQVGLQSSLATGETNNAIVLVGYLAERLREALSRRFGQAPSTAQPAG